MKFIKTIVLFFMVFSMVACEKQDPLTKEEIQKFIDDSEYVLSVLETARLDGFRELTIDEEREFLAYEANYGDETDFQKATSNSTIKLLVAELSLMKLQLGDTGTVVGDYDPKKDYLSYKESVNKDMKDVKAFLQDYGTESDK